MHALKNCYSSGVLYAVVVLVTIGMAGCVSRPYVPPTDTEVPNEAKEDQEPKTQPKRSTRAIAPPVRKTRVEPSPAAQQILANALKAESRGDYDQAILLLERAQRMTPQAGDIYLAMAQVRFSQQDFRTAEQMCLKALSLSGDDRKFKSRAWRTLASVRHARGDTDGAKQALENSNKNY